MEEFYPIEFIADAVLFVDADKSEDKQVKAAIEHLQASVVSFDGVEPTEKVIAVLNTKLAPLGVVLESVGRSGCVFFVQVRHICADCGKSISQLEADAVSSEEAAQAIGASATVVKDYYRETTELESIQ
jgi:hypothetical protein